MKKYAMGGRMMRPERGSIAERRQEMREIPGLKPVPVRPIKDEEPVYNKGGKIKKMRVGGMGSEPRRPEPIAPRERITRDNMPMRGGRRFAGGGSVSSASKRADGIASKGKTKGKMIKMRMGGKC